MIRYAERTWPRARLISGAFLARCSTTAQKLAKKGMPWPSLIPPVNRTSPCQKSLIGSNGGLCQPFHLVFWRTNSAANWSATPQSRFPVCPRSKRRDRERSVFCQYEVCAQGKRESAAAILATERLTNTAAATLISKNPYYDFARALALFYTPPAPQPGISTRRPSSRRQRRLARMRPSAPTSS